MGFSVHAGGRFTSRRGSAACVDAPLLRASSTHGDEVSALAEGSHRRKSLASKSGIVREGQRERRSKKRIRPSTERRLKAVQAYWAMHVEAMTCSGITAQALPRRIICRCTVRCVGGSFRGRRGADRLE